MDFEYLGPYRVEKVLGRGGMGSVYLGTHSNSGDSVALKVIASALADQERFRRRFAAEVETLKRLKHANIVQLIGYGEEQGHLFYSMEYVAGQSLADTLKKCSRIEPDRAIVIAIEVCSALKHAHDFGIIHRDLKPANVMLTSTGQVKLTDFGIAKLFGSADVTAAGSVLGTADYMPPEQAEGKPVTVRSDLYALGSMLYAMISGRSPHAAKSLPEVLYNVRYTIPQPLDEIVPDTPLELSELVSQLLAKDQSQRPPTALVVGNRLRSLQQGLKHRRSTSADSRIIDIREVDELRNILSNSEEQTQVIHSDQPFTVDQDKLDRSRVDLANARTQAVSQLDSQALEAFDDSVQPGKTRFTIVDEEKRSRRDRGGNALDEPQHALHWISVLALLLLIATSIGAIFYFSQSPSADRLFEQISTAIDSGSDDDLMDIEPVIAKFESLYPSDSRIAELATVKVEIEEQRTIRRLLRRAKAVGSEAEMDPVEQAFLDCTRAQQQDPELARRKLTAFLAVFMRPDRLTTRQQKLVEIATSMLKKLDSGSNTQVNPATELLNEQIDWAVSNLSGEPQQTFYRSLLELYSDKAWSAPAIARVRKLMSDPAK
jgi:serine/threonine-protein kinase